MDSAMIERLARELFSLPNGADWEPALAGLPESDRDALEAFRNRLSENGAGIRSLLSMRTLESWT